MKGGKKYEKQKFNINAFNGWSFSWSNDDGFCSNML